MLGYWSRDLHLLNKVVVCSKHFILILKMHFFTEKRLKITNRHSAQKVHCMKVSKYGNFFSPYFPVLGLNTEIYGVNLRIQFDYRKIRKKKSVFGPFSRSGEQKMVQKVSKEGCKKVLYFTDTNVCKSSILLFHFFVIWLSVKYKDFLIITKLSQIFHVLIFFL